MLPIVTPQDRIFAALNRVRENRLPQPVPSRTLFSGFHENLRLSQQSPVCKFPEKNTHLTESPFSAHCADGSGNWLLASFFKKESLYETILCHHPKPVARLAFSCFDTLFHRRI